MAQQTYVIKAVVTTAMTQEQVLAEAKTAICRAFYSVERVRVEPLEEDGDNLP